MTFHPGELLTIHPQDDADPLANQRAGEQVTFVKYRLTPAQKYDVSVKDDKGREFVFRAADLRGVHDA